MRVRGIRRAGDPPPRLRPNALSAYKARDSVHAVLLPLRLELRVYARTAVGATTRAVNDFDRLRELCVGCDACTRRPVDPCIIASLRHHEYPAHRRDVVRRCVDQDERESHCGLLAKKAVAFPRMSRSSRTRASSRRNRRISSSWLIGFPFPGKTPVTPWLALVFAWRVHCWSMSGRMPNSSATALIERSPARRAGPPPA